MRMRFEAYHCPRFRNIAPGPQALDSQETRLTCLWEDRFGGKERGLLPTILLSLPSRFCSTTTGLVVLGPLSSKNATECFRVAYSIDARWNKAQHQDTASSTGLRSKGSFIGTKGNEMRSNGVIHTKALLIDEGRWTRISAEQSWLDAPTPLVPVWAGKTLTTASKSETSITALPNLVIAPSVSLTTANMTNSAEQWWISEIETVVSTAMADAISRGGLAQQYDSLKFYSSTKSLQKQCVSIHGDANRYFCLGLTVHAVDIFSLCVRQVPSFNIQEM
jgi:hypothetical protein